MREHKINVEVNPAFVAAVASALAASLLLRSGTLAAALLLLAMFLLIALRELTLVLLSYFSMKAKKDAGNESAEGRESKKEAS